MTQEKTVQAKKVKESKLDSDPVKWDPVTFAVTGSFPFF